MQSPIQKFDNLGLYLLLRFTPALKAKMESAIPIAAEKIRKCENCECDNQNPNKGYCLTPEERLKLSQIIMSSVYTYFAKNEPFPAWNEETGRAIPYNHDEKYCGAYPARGTQLIFIFDGAFTGLCKCTLESVIAHESVHQLNQRRDDHPNYRKQEYYVQTQCFGCPWPVSW